jgi:tetratricopeptide (TPR) repeat protein
MTNERRRRIEAVYHLALEKEAGEERSAYLDSACGDDADLRASVEGLLKAYDEAGDFLESPPLGTNVTLDSSPISEGPGTVIGRYKLLEQIGEGGFGVVYMAEQTKPISRRVALKIIKWGMDTKQVIARFEAERQALAMMDHPNIAKVLDAGATDTGRPYFVMELVRGIPITEYCDKNELNTRQRLELFTEVCKAVQHAHQKGIIHRDLKPSNVMITLSDDDSPVPKIIDFGIAKATQARLTEKTLFTGFKQFIGTPEYMSPEQARMGQLDVDTRSDIYSLGVLLYELVTGTTPFEAKQLRSAAFDEIIRIIREEEPDKPSTRLSTLGDTLAEIAKHRHVEPAELCKIVRGDLDWVVMRALEKDRTRRYETANELAQDIQRHLGHEPVLASPPNRIYRARKFVRRHRTGVVSGLLVGTAIVTGLVVSSVMYFQAEQARREARRQAMISQAVNEFLNDDLLASVNPRRTKGHEVTVMEVLDAAAEKLDGKFEDEPSVEAAIRQTLGKTYRSLGKYESAEPHYERVVELYRSLFGAEHPDTLESMAQLGFVYADQWRHEEAERLWVKVLECRRRVLGQEDPATLGLMSWMGWLRNRQERFKEAEQLLVKTLEIERRVLGEEHGATLWTMATLAWSYTAQDRYDEAEPLLVKALEGQRRVIGEENTRILVVMDALANMVYLSQDRYEEAEPLLVEMLEARQRLVGEEHPTTWLAIWNLARMYNEQGRYQEAERQYRRCIAIGRKLLEDFPADGDHVRFFGYALRTQYWILRNSGQTQAAEDMLSEAISHWEKLATEHPDESHDQHIYGNSLSWLGGMLRGKGQLEEAEEVFQKALSADTRAIELDPNNPAYWLERADTYSTMEQWEKALGDYSRAIELDPDNPDSWRGRANTYSEMEQWDRALGDYSRAIELNPEDPDYWLERADTYSTMEQWDKALGDHSRAIELDPDNPDSWRGRANTYSTMEQWEKALGDHSRAIELDPNNPDSWLGRADTYSKMEQWDEALSDFSEAIELDSNNPRCWYGRADVYSSMNKWDKAVTDYTKAIEFDPDNAHYWHRRGGCYKDMGDAERGVDDYTKAIELARTKSHYWHMRGVCYLQLDEPNKAVADYNIAIQLDPNDSYYRYMRGKIYIKMKQWDEAVADFSRAMELAPDNPHFPDWRASAYCRAGQFENAISDSSKAIELDPNDPGLWVGRARAYRELKQWDKAVADYNSAIALDPNNLQYLFMRGRTYADMRQWDRVVADFSKAIELDPNKAYFRDWRAAAYYHKGQFERAVSDLSKAIELAPNVPELWLGRANACSELKQWDKALADCSKAIELDPNSVSPRYLGALMYLGMGDTEGYRRRCAQMLDRFSRTEDAAAAHRVAWTCVLAADAVEDFSRVVELAEFAIAKDSKADQSLTTLGAILHRAGRFDEAVEQLSELAAKWERAEDIAPQTSPAYTWFFLAMAHHQLGNADESQRYFELAAEQEKAGDAGWNRRLTLQLVRAEAESLLGVSQKNSPDEKEVMAEEQE